jgi:MFS family permease
VRSSVRRCLVCDAFGPEAVYYIARFLSAVIVALISSVFADEDRSDCRREFGSIKRIQFIVNKQIILSTCCWILSQRFSANTLMPVSRDVLHVGVLEYGWLSAAQSVGAVIAALVISQLPELRRQGQLFLGSVVVFGAATIVFGVSTTLILAWFALAVTGAADSVSTIIRNTIRQLQTPDFIRGRMTSVNQIFFMGGPQLGEVEAGVVAQFLARHWPLSLVGSVASSGWG